MKKKFLMAVSTFCLTAALCTTSAYAARPVDNDLDGYKSNVDCNDNDPTVNVLNSCGDCAAEPISGECPTASCAELTFNSCQSSPECEWSGSRRKGSCNDIFLPPQTETICDDLVDNDGDNLTDCQDSDCSADPACQVSSCLPTAENPHACNTYDNYPENCLSCHDGGLGGSHYDEVLGSVHYKWLGEPQDMLNDQGSPQGKLTNSMNAYCINIMGNWAVCGTCHVGRGQKPLAENDTNKQNIDCLMCHNQDYALARVRLADGSMGVENPDDAMVKNLQAPTNTICLKCHAFAGGGDGVKRGDLANKLKSNTDPHYDVHMNTAGANVQCIDCHTFTNHKVSGKGSDLRPTDYASEVQCIKCHQGKDSSTGHATAKINDHVDKVACQTCHIPTYAKTPTETHRNWQTHLSGTKAATCGPDAPCPGHPDHVMEANLAPTYKFWNRQSDNYLLGDLAITNPDTNHTTYQTSMPAGDINNGKLYPFKYKTSEAPLSSENMLIAVDTFEYLKGSGNINTAIENGLANMASEGLVVGDFKEWVTTDTYQLLNHGVEPAANALTCAECHDSDLIPFASLGYDTFPAKVRGCTLCHSYKSGSFTNIHERHVDGKGIDCANCHSNEPSGLKTSISCSGCHENHELRTYEGATSLHKNHADETSCSGCHLF